MDARLSALHRPRLRRHLRAWTTPRSSARAAAACSTSPTTGTACRRRSRFATSRRSGPSAPIRSASAASGASANCCRSPPPETGRDHRRRPDHPASAPTASASYVGMEPGRLFLQYEGMNPSGSFKDNGMTAAFTHARMVGARRAACASTGNTSASLAVFCSATGLMRADHLHRQRQDLLRQTGPGARPRRPDRADRRRLRRRHAAACSRSPSTLGIYLVNSINPFRLEGQKTIMYPRPGGAALGGARLDRRARRQPRQRQRLRQGVHRAAPSWA